MTATAKPIDDHECHCNVYKGVTGQQHTHVAFFNHGDIQVDHPELMNRVPFNKDNPNGPLEICVCKDCGAALMLDDKQGRIRVAVPYVMGYDGAKFPKATLTRFPNPLELFTSKGCPRVDSLSLAKGPAFL